MILSPGSLLICYTDGITEAMNARQEEFGFEGLQKVIADYADAGSEGMAAAILQSVAGWVGSTEQHDDITLLLAHRN